MTDQVFNPDEGPKEAPAPQSRDTKSVAAQMQTLLQEAAFVGLSADEMTTWLRETIINYPTEHAANIIKIFEIVSSMPGPVRVALGHVFPSLEGTEVTDEWLDENAALADRKLEETQGDEKHLGMEREASGMVIEDVGGYYSNLIPDFQDKFELIAAEWDALPSAIRLQVANDMSKFGILNEERLSDFLEKNS